jgi:hypothetical protein
MPGLAATVAEEIEALRRVAGDKAVKLIRREPDAMIAKIVAGWPRTFDARRALALGFRADASFDDINPRPPRGRARQPRSASTARVSEFRSSAARLQICAKKFAGLANRCSRAD